VFVLLGGSERSGKRGGGCARFRISVGFSTASFSLGNALFAVERTKKECTLQKTH